MRPTQPKQLEWLGEELAKLQLLTMVVDTQNNFFVVSEAQALAADLGARRITLSLQRRLSS
jgi:Mg-chelatase subunit ChlD